MPYSSSPAGRRAIERSGSSERLLPDPLSLAFFSVSLLNVNRKITWQNVSLPYGKHRGVIFSSSFRVAFLHHRSLSHLLSVRGGERSLSLRLFRLTEKRCEKLRGGKTCFRHSNEHVALLFAFCIALRKVISNAIICSRLLGRGDDFKILRRAEPIFG